MRSPDNNPTDHDITRRHSVKLILASLASFALPSLAEAHETEVEDLVFERKGENINQLHSEVANPFIEALGKKLRKENNLIVTTFSISLSNPDGNGLYSLSFKAGFRKIRPDEKPDRHVDRRGTVLKDPRAVRKENIRKVYEEPYTKGQNWLENMEARFGGISTTEIAHSKNDHLFIEEWLVVTK